MNKFTDKYTCQQVLVVGEGQGIGLDLFLQKSPDYWFSL
jgi:hypothetical protein